MRKWSFTKVKIGIRMYTIRNRNRTRSTNINMYSKAMRRGPVSKVKTVIQIWLGNVFSSKHKYKSTKINVYSKAMRRESISKVKIGI